MPRLTKGETIGFLVGYSVAILSTFVRLGHRLHRRQAWWDDLWAFIAVFFAIFNVIVYLLLNLPENAATTYDLNASSFLLWSSFQFQPIIVWSSRISIQVTVIRFLSPGRNRFISKCAVVVLLMMYIVAAITKIFYCGRPVPKLPVCTYQKMPSVVALCFDVISTAWLVGWPIFLLARMKMARPGRNLIIACFATSLLLGAMDIFHATNLLLGAVATLNISGHVEMMVALVLCNILVLVTYIYRVFRGPNEGAESESDSSSDDDISRSKREATTRSRLPRGTITMSERPTTTQASSDPGSSVGPLTTVYSSTVEYSSQVDSNVSYQQATNPTSPQGSFASKESKP